MGKSGRRLRLGLQTLLGLGARGFFIPYRYAEGIGHGDLQAGFPEIEAILAARQESFAAWLDAMGRYREDLAAIGADTPPEPRWNQDWFPRLDATMAYTLTRETRPTRIVEVGSGHSTRFFARAVRDGGLETRLLSIDPQPRATLEGLPISFHRKTLQRAGMEPFEDLAAGDVVFIDSSHILMPGTDLAVFLGRVLPRLPKGIHLHIHDIFLPDAYPEAWGWRGYNEQLAVLPLLLGGWEILFASHYVATRMSDAVAASAAGALPLNAGAVESSLWLKKLG
ncbi:MAG: class I SAM-dependent methyltransferase [Rhodovibrionaceae bacterium]